MSAEQKGTLAVVVNVTNERDDLMTSAMPFALMWLLRPLSAEPVFSCPSDNVEGSGAAKDV